MDGGHLQMRVTFVNPYYKHHVGPVSVDSMPPLSLLNCATLLKKKGIEVQVLDADILRMSPLQVAKEVAGSDVLVVATSPRYTWQCPPLEISPFYAVLEEVRLDRSRPLLITTGPSSLFNLKRLAEMSDIVIIGQPEPFFQQISPDMETEDYFSLQGIAYLKEGKLKRTSEPRGYNLKKLPQPDFKLLPYQKYRHPVLGGPLMMMETSRGCPEGCSFCFQGMTGYSFSSKAPEQVLRELTYVREVLKIRNVVFMDLEISVAQESFKKWMNGMIARNLDIQWACWIRMSALADLEVVALMARAGCCSVTVGLESSHEAAFKEFPKNKDREYVLGKVRQLQEHGIEVTGNFIIGALYDKTEEDIMNTVDYATWLGIDYATFYIARPYPTTRFHKQIGNQLLTLSSEGVPVCYNKHFTHDELVRLKAKAYMRFYLNPRYVLGHLGSLLRPREFLSKLRLFYTLVKK